jgi:hypothetical protein
MHTSCSDVYFVCDNAPRRPDSALPQSSRVGWAHTSMWLSNEETNRAMRAPFRRRRCMRDARVDIRDGSCKYAECWVSQTHLTMLFFLRSLSADYWRQKNTVSLAIAALLCRWTVPSLRLKQLPPLPIDFEKNSFPTRCQNLLTLEIIINLLIITCDFDMPSAYTVTVFCVSDVFARSKSSDVLHSATWQSSGEFKTRQRYHLWTVYFLMMSACKKFTSSPADAC